MRLLPGLAVVLVLAGCGSASTGPGKPAAAGAPVAPAPPIVPLDEAPPEPVARMLDMLFAPPSSATSGFDHLQTTITWAAGGPTTTTSAPTPAQIAEASAQLEAQRRALEPAADSTPRVVARLPLADGGEALFVDWHNDAGRLCTYTSITHASGGGGGMGGACVEPQQAQCTAICLASDGSGVLSADDWVLSGTVPADADALDVTTADGATAEYPLAGPVLDGDRRVFMLDLGAQDWRQLALVRGGDVVAETAMPVAQVAGEECERKAGPMPPPPTEPPTPASGESPEVKAWNDAFQACLQAHGSTP